MALFHCQAYCASSPRPSFRTISVGLGGTTVAPAWIAMGPTSPPIMSGVAAAYMYLRENLIVLPSFGLQVRGGSVLLVARGPAGPGRRPGGPGVRL